MHLSIPLVATIYAHSGGGMSHKGKIAKGVVIALGSALILLFLWKRSKSGQIAMKLGDINQEAVNVPDFVPPTIPGYDFGNSDNKNPAFNNSNMSGEEYLTMFGMVSGGSPAQKQKDVLSPIKGAWGSISERDAYYAAHNIDINGYQHSIPGNYLDNFTQSASDEASQYTLQQQTIH